MPPFFICLLKMFVNNDDENGIQIKNSYSLEFLFIYAYAVMTKQDLLLMHL